MVGASTVSVPDDEIQICLEAGFIMQLTTATVEVGGGRTAVRTSHCTQSVVCVCLVSPAVRQAGRQANHNAA